MPKPVAIILLNWNTPVHTANCIVSLRRYCDAALFDIIVADNGSADNSLEFLKAQFSDLIYIDNKENLGFAEGNNRALTYSMANGYSYSLVMNTDTEVDEDIVQKLMKHLDDHQETAAVQPAIYWMHDKTKIWNGRGYFNRIFGWIKTDNALPATKNDDFKPADWVTGCCMLIRNAHLEKTGGFNKRFFLYYEDVELSFRLRAAGYQVTYLPSCKMYHEAGVSAKANVEKPEGALSPVIHFYTSRNRIWILRKYGKPLCYPVYFISSGTYYVALWLYFKLRQRNEKARQLFQGVKDGLLTPKTLI